MGKNRDVRLLRTRNFERIYNKLKLLSTNCFEYENLPDGIQSRYIEDALYESGQLVFFEDGEYGELCLPCYPSAKLDVYGDPLGVIAVGFNLTRQVNLQTGKAVRILNNSLALPNRIQVRDYAEQMLNIEEGIRANIKQQKFPYMFLTTDKTLMSKRAIFEEIELGEPLILASKGMDLNDLSVMNLNVPVVFPELRMEKNNLENEILTSFGLNNTNDKKERLLVDEVNANNDFINRNLEIMLEERQKGFDRVNEVFGYNIVVKLKENFNNDYDDEEDYKDGEVDTGTI